MKARLLLLALVACDAPSSKTRAAPASDSAAVASSPAPVRPSAAPIASGGATVRVETAGTIAKIIGEAPVGGSLPALAGRYRLRVTQIDLLPGGLVGPHNHLGPGIRLVTQGELEYILPESRTMYGPGETFFESGDVSHRVLNRGYVTCQHLLFEVLGGDVKGTSLILPRDRGDVPDGRSLGPTRPGPGAWRDVDVPASTSARARVLEEATVAGYLSALDGKYELRLTQIELGPAGRIGPHPRSGPAMRLVTSGVLTVESAAGKAEVHAGETRFDEGDEQVSLASDGQTMSEHLLFELLPADAGSSFRK